MDESVPQNGGSVVSGADHQNQYCNECRWPLINGMCRWAENHERHRRFRMQGEAKRHLLSCPYKKPGIRWSNAVLTKQEEDRQINYNLSKFMDSL